jgi:SOS-response transcriptional repressor LexA
MTKLQAKILTFIREFILKNGYSPSGEEIAKGVGTHATTARLNVNELHRRGYIIKGEGVRNIRLPDEGHNARVA